MKQILSNKVENAILNMLSISHPHKASEIHNYIQDNNIGVSYKYVYKTLQSLIKQKIIEKSESKYQLNNNYIKQIKSLSDDASSSYQIDQNVFLKKLNSSILSVLKDKEKERIYQDMLSLLNKNIMVKLDEWYSAYYDKEKKEFKKIMKESNLKGKNVLELGCGTGRITFQLTKYAKSVTSIDNDDSYLRYCREKANKTNTLNLKLIKKNIMNLGTLNKKYDVIVSGWAGIHYAKDPLRIVKSLYKLLKKGGILIVIEAYSDSDYIKVLDAVRRKKNNIIPTQKELKNYLFRVFNNLREDVVNSYYKFPDIETAEETFKIELVYEEGKVWTKNDSKNLRKALKRLDNPLKVSEPPQFFICKKSTN